MERRPVREQEGLVALPVVGLEVAAAGLAVVDAQPGLSLDGHGRQPLRVAFAERASGSLVLPARAAATAARAAACAPDRLRPIAPWRARNRRSGSSGEASARRLANGSNASTTGARISRQHGPPEVSQQPGGRRRERLVAQQPGRRRGARHRGFAAQSRRPGPRRPPPAFPARGCEASLSTSATIHLARRARGRVRRWRSAGAARPRGTRRRSRPSREWPGFADVDAGRRAIDLRAKLRDRPEVGMRLQPAVQRQRAQWPSLGSALARTGRSRAPRPNRKMVAAIRPIETPHSKIDGT